MHYAPNQVTPRFWSKHFKLPLARQPLQKICYRIISFILLSGKYLKGFCSYIGGRERVKNRLLPEAHMYASKGTG